MRDLYRTGTAPHTVSWTGTRAAPFSFLGIGMATGAVPLSFPGRPFPRTGTLFPKAGPRIFLDLNGTRFPIPYAIVYGFGRGVVCGPGPGKVAGTLFLYRQ